MSDQTGRIKNDPAARQGPDRSPQNAVNQAAAQPGAAALGGDVADAIEKGVRLGYSVIEDYLKLGERFARQCNGRSYSVADYGRDLQSATEGLFTAFTDMSTRWVELVSSVVGGSLGQTGRSPATSSGSGASTSPSGSVASGVSTPASSKASEVSVEVTASRACGVRLDMGLPTGAQVLSADDLVRLTGGAEPLRAELEVGDGGRRVLVRLDIPAGQRGGEYTGSVFDPRLQTKLGALTVMLKDPPRVVPDARPPRDLVGRDIPTTGNKGGAATSVDRARPEPPTGPEPIELTKVQGVGPASAQKLKRAGITDARKLADSDATAINSALGASPASTLGHKLRRKARQVVS